MSVKILSFCGEFEWTPFSEAKGKNFEYGPYKFKIKRAKMTKRFAKEIATLAVHGIAIKKRPPNWPDAPNGMTDPKPKKRKPKKK